MTSPAAPQRRRRWRLAAAAAAAVALAAGFGARLSSSTPATARDPQAATVEFAAADLVQAERRALARTLPITGTLWPHAETLVKARAAGELQSLAVREGEAVRRGQTLGRIDPVEARARLAQQQAELEAALAQLQMARKNWTLQQTLLQRQYISRNAFDTTESNHEVAAARVRAAEAALAVAAKGLRDTELLAPIDGIVAQRFARPGERVAVDARVLSLMDLARLEVTVPVPAADIARVRVGQAVRFQVEGYAGREFAGRVERINPAAVQGSRSIDVYVGVDNADGLLRGGLFATGRLTLEELPETVVLPRSAVREEGGRSVVYAIEAGRIARREPRLGAVLAEEGLVQVLEGIAAGTPVVRHNLGALADGASAQVASAPARP